MNREERRSMKSQGASEETIEKLGAYNSPCTIAEAVQIARASAEDVLEDYHRNQGTAYLAMSIQIELLKEVIFSSGMIKEEEFRERYMKKAREIQESQMNQAREAKEESGITEMKLSANEIEITRE